jgi:threonylcarbamoyladenosine tRNA methylthiotransferase MtaB
MRRPYTFSYYRCLIDRIKNAIPNASIGSDLIVGFPGETDEDFNLMCSALGSLPLTYMHVFPYSDRPGTTAAALRPKVEGVRIRERSREIRAIAERKATMFRQSQEGTVRRALTVDDGWSAVTDNYLKVRLDRQQTRNEWVQVRIEDQHVGRVL